MELGTYNKVTATTLRSLAKAIEGGETVLFSVWCNDSQKFVDMSFTVDIPIQNRLSQHKGKDGKTRMALSKYIG
jgi:hypothetical protein